MLPSFARLRLEDRRVPTGEFYRLTKEEAEELNKGGGEPITRAHFMPHGCKEGEVDDDDDDAECFETFRVWGRDPATGRKDPNHYTVYDAQALWSNLQSKMNNPQNFTDPKTRNPFWREDWYELHDKYDPDGPVPAKVRRLPRMSLTSTFPPFNLPYPDTEDEDEDEWEQDWDSDEEEEEEGFGDDDTVPSLFELHSPRRGLDLWYREVVQALDNPSEYHLNRLQNTIDDMIEFDLNQDLNDPVRPQVMAILNEPEWSQWLKLVINNPRRSASPTIGLILHLLQWYARDEDGRSLLRALNEGYPWIKPAIEAYIRHLEGLMPPSPGGGTATHQEWEFNEREALLEDARRAKHFLKWQRVRSDTSYRTGPPPGGAALTMSLRSRDVLVEEIDRKVDDFNRTHLRVHPFTLNDPEGTDLVVLFDQQAKELRTLFRQSEGHYNSKRTDITISLFLTLISMRVRQMDIESVSDAEWEQQPNITNFASLVYEMTALVRTAVSTSDPWLYQEQAPRVADAMEMEEFFWHRVSELYDEGDLATFDTQKIEDALFKLFDTWRYEEPADFLRRWESFPSPLARERSASASGLTPNPRRQRTSARYSR